MRKTRFLWMLAILLLWVLVTVSCSTVPPTEVPPTEAPPTDVPEPPKEPLVIEPGEVFVSGLWKDSYVAKNPCPDDVSGSVIEHQKLLYQRVKVVGDRKEGAYRLYRAGSLTEAAAMIDTAALSNAELLAELCENVSRVDFEQFYVVMVVGAYGDAITPQGLLLDQLVMSDEGFPTVIYQKKRDAAPAGEACPTLYADFLLIRREAIPHLADDATMEIGHYICTRADVVLVPAEPVISDDWQDDTPAVNPCPEAVSGTPLRYEDVWFGGALQHNGDWNTDEIYAADDLTEAARLLRTYVRDYYDASFDVLCDRVCQIDFSRFRLLLFIEKSITGSWPAFYDFTGLVHDGQGKLTRMNCLLEYDGGGTDDMAAFAHFVLVRRADYDAPAERMQVDAYYYQAPPNVIEPGEIVVSPYWEGKEALDGGTLNFEELLVLRKERSRHYDCPVARNLTEAAAIIDDITYDQSESCLALNEVVSHVDFSQFYLLFVHEEYQKEEHITRVTLEAMEQSENGTLVLYYPYTGEENVDAPYGIAYVRLILIRREGLDYPRESLTQSPHYYQIEEN